MALRYCVYLVTGWTTRGTYRRYIGYARSLTVRKYWHGLKKKPAWMRCMRKETLTYDSLKSGLTSLADALREEAIISAAEICKHPLTARGGPWSSPKKLSEAQLMLAKQVAKSETTEQLYSLVSADRRSSPARHLSNVKFDVTEDEHKNVTVFMRTRRDSGTPGNRVRRSHIWEGRYEPNDDNHKIAQRGRDFSERRKLETSRREKRRKKTLCFAICSADAYSQILHSSLHLSKHTTIS